MNCWKILIAAGTILLGNEAATRDTSADWTISSRAAHVAEGSTAIPVGSREQALPKHAPAIVADDMVCACTKVQELPRMRWQRNATDVGGKAVVHLKGFTFNQTTQFVQVDQDIGALVTISQPVSATFGGNLSFNLTADDFANLYNAAVAQTAVALYLYPSSSSTTTKQYLYGNAFLGSFQTAADVGGTVAGTVDFQNSDTTGFTIQTRA